MRKQIAFRDRLIHDTEIRNEYQRLKEKLAEQYGDNKLAYTDAKTAFINDVLRGMGF